MASVLKVVFVTIVMCGQGEGETEKRDRQKREILGEFCDSVIALLIRSRKIIEQLKKHTREILRF